MQSSWHRILNSNTSVCITFTKLKPCTSWRHWKTLKQRRSVPFSVACLQIAPQQLRSPIWQSLLAGSGQSSSSYKAWHWNLDHMRTVLCNLEALCNKYICTASISSEHHVNSGSSPIYWLPKKNFDPEGSQKSQVLRLYKFANSDQTQRSTLSPRIYQLQKGSS